jgi:copper chaperone CopZ
MCSKAIYKALLKVPFIQKVDVDIEKSAYEISFKPNTPVSPDALKKAVEGAGFAVAQLSMTATLPKVVADKDVQVTLQGATYRLIQGKSGNIQGQQTFTIVDKGYVPTATWKRYAKDIPSSRERGVYFITLKPS